MRKKFSRVELKRLLETTELSIADVARQLGASYSYVYVVAAKDLGIDLRCRRQAKYEPFIQDLLTTQDPIKALARKYDISLTVAYRIASREDIDLKQRQINRSEYRH